jgi:hypothetical protein
MIEDPEVQRVQQGHWHQRDLEGQQGQQGQQDQQDQHYLHLPPEGLLDRLEEP